LLVAIPLRVAALPERVGSEFQVDSYTAGGQQDPALACTTSNDFVVAWTAPASSPGASSVIVQRENASGSALGPRYEAPAGSCANGCPVAPPEHPSLCRAGDGFVVVWERAYAADGDGSGVFGQRFDSTGAPRGTEFQVNSYTPGYEYAASVACEDDGDFVAVWQRENAADLGIFGRRFASAGNAVGTEFRADTVFTAYRTDPRAAIGASGAFVVVWTSGDYTNGPDGDGLAVAARRYDSAGTAQGAEFVVNTYTRGYQQRPAVAALADGFVVAWESGDYYVMRDGSYSGVFARRLSSTALPIGGEFQINNHTDGYQQRPAVAGDGAGGFAVAWQSGDVYGPHDGSYAAVFARRFLSTGSPQGTEFQANTYTLGDQSYPSICADDLGSFVVAWTSIGQDGDEQGIFGRAHVVSDVTGHVRYYVDDRPVPDVDVALLGGPEPAALSNDAGGFHFDAATGGTRALRPSKNGGVNGAVTSLDSAWATQFRLQLRELDEFQQLACDVTGNGTISSLDAARILQFKVGIIDRLPVAQTCGSDWLFLPNPASAPNQSLIQPGTTAATCTPGGISFSPLATPVHAQDFKAILFGDCTGNWKP
jgi:hypothetical protein